VQEEEVFSNSISATEFMRSVGCAKDMLKMKKRLLNPNAQVVQRRCTRRSFFKLNLCNRVFERCKRCAGDEQEVVERLFAQLHTERRKRGKLLQETKNWFNKVKENVKESLVERHWISITLSF